MKSNCTVRFGRNDFQTSRLRMHKCPIKNCDAALVPVAYQKIESRMRYLPFCSMHGLRIHPNTFTYFNGPSRAEINAALRRNIWASPDYYINRVVKSGAKPEPWLACYENSEDAIIWNVFAEISRNKRALSDLLTLITGKHFTETPDLYLWGRKVDLAGNTYVPYQPLDRVRQQLERDIRKFPTRPDIMLVIPKKLVVCVEAKFGGANPVADNAKSVPGEKPRKVAELIKRYYRNNIYLELDPIFEAAKPPEPFYEQLFRNIVFAASMAKIEGPAEWFSANLRSAHVMNIKRGRPESLPVTKNVRSFLAPQYRKHFAHITWEDIFRQVIKGNAKLADLAWYLKNKSFECVRAFNIM
ncbi:MAG: hypothetical protein AB1599_06885 [Planctomycetota bacterium]